MPACTEDDEETLGQIFYDRVAVAVGNRIRECGPRVPVITGKSHILRIPSCRGPLHFNPIQSHLSSPCLDHDV